MEQYDFSICKFIDEEMWFFTYYDFCDNRHNIKQLFETLDKNQKLFYKWYIFANIHMNETYKNAIWDYLNQFEEYYEINLLNLKRFYKAK